MEDGPRITLRYPYFVKIGGQRQYLAQGPAQILFALMMKPECSLDYLMEVAWPGNTIRPLYTRSIISVYIYHIRVLLRGHWRIVNRFGQGWRLEKDTCLK